MLIANFITKRPQMGETATYEEFFKVIGAKPHRLGIMAKLYPELTASFLTESLFNVYTLKPKMGKLESIESLYFEWETDVNFVKVVEFAARPQGDGMNGSEIEFAFKERYYEKYDIFRILKSRQQIFVTQRPVRKADNYWVVVGRLIDDDFNSVLDASACEVGDGTRFQSTAHPELSEEGYSKSQSSIERHRNYLTFFRNDISYSSLYAAHEDVFISVAEGKDQGCLSECVYKMNKLEKDLLDTFQFAKNTGLLMNKSSVDKNGKSTICDPDTGRPVVIGEGIIPQIERFASKAVYNKLNSSVITQALAVMREKADKDEGNRWIMTCNSKMWDDIQLYLSGWLANFKPTDTYLWSKGENKGNGGYINVGATYQSFQFGGNILTFRVDRALTREFGAEKGFGLIVDLTTDMATGKPALAGYTLKGYDFRLNELVGVGGLNGTSGGVVSTPVAGSKKIASGYAGVGVFAPYRSFILLEA